MKLTKRAFGLLLIITLMISWMGIIPVTASEPVNTQFEDTVQEDLLSEEIVPCTTTLDEEFSEDTVIVTMKLENSTINKVIPPSYFSEIDVIEIIDLTYIEGDIEANELINKDAFHQILSLKIKSTGKQDVLDTIKALEERDDILAAEPCYYYEIITFGTPNDPYYNKQWGLNNIKVAKAWDISTGSKDIKIGVLDGPFNKHNDLSGNMLPGIDFNTNNTIKMQEQGTHGTAVASVLGAVGNNNMGISGVAQNISIVPMSLPLKNDGGMVPVIKYAMQNNINIINASFGFGAPEGYAKASVADRRAIENYNGLLICAAGNEGNNNDNTRDHAKPYPASYDLDNVISVAASDEDNELANTRFLLWGWKSNYGKTSVDLAAPGTDIWVAGADGNYASVSGTSYATPHVAGVAGLIKSYNPDLSASDIKNIILDTVTKSSALSDLVSTGGVLNAEAALTLASTYVPTRARGGSGFTTAAGWFDRENSRERVWPADINGDKRMDIVGITSTGNISYAKSLGSGAFENSKIISTEIFESNAGWFARNSHQRVWPADINGDGYTDFVGVATDGRIYASLNNRNFTFSGKIISGTKETGFKSSAGWFDLNTAERVWPADIDGDGKMDIVGISLKGDVYFCRSKGDGTFEPMQSVSTGIFLTEHNWFSSSENPRVWPADVNGDKKTDFVGIAKDGRIYVNINTSSNGKYSFTTTYISGTSDSGFATNANWFKSLNTDRVWPADVDGDGKVDLVGLTYTGSVYWAKSKGNGQFESLEKIYCKTFKSSAGWFYSSSTQRIWPADITGDRKVDFVGVAENGKIYSAMRNN